MPEGVKGIVRAKGISLEEGLLENIRNKGVEEIDLELYDLTRITEGLSIHDYSSQQSASTAPDTDGAAVNVLDGNVRTYWHSVWSDASYQLPQYVSVDLGETQEIYKDVMATPMAASRNTAFPSAPMESITPKCSAARSRTSMASSRWNSRR